MPDEASTPLLAGAGQLPATHWSVVLAAGASDDPRSHEALTRLCQTYWYPLYAFVRRHGHGREEAQDLTQAFFLHLLEHHALAKADPAKGKFRSYLLASLRHFLSNEQARAAAQKRGGGRTPIPLDVAFAETRYALEATETGNPDKVFERNWALALLEQVLARLREEQAAAGKGDQFDQLRPWLMGDREAGTYANLAAAVGTSADAAKMAVCRLRRRYGELLREEIAHTIASPQEIDEEIRHLLAVLGR